MESTGKRSSLLQRSGRATKDMILRCKRVRKLAPEGGSLIHIAEHLGSWIDPKPREDQQELEELLDLMQPGWRQVIIKKRPLPNMLVSNVVVTAAAGGLAGRPDEKIGDNLYIVGDWVGKEGLLSNVSFASAKRAADLILDA